MRSCVLSLVLFMLVVANGYALWEIHQMRATLTDLHADLRQREGPDLHSMADVARDAAEAVGRGELNRAQADLERLSELLEQTGQGADRRREELVRQLRRAQESIEKGSSKATEEVEDLVRMLSREEKREDVDPD